MISNGKENLFEDLKGRIRDYSSKYCNEKQWKYFSVSKSKVGVDALKNKNIGISIPKILTFINKVVLRNTKGKVKVYLVGNYVLSFLKNKKINCAVEFCSKLNCEKMLAILYKIKYIQIEKINPFEEEIFFLYRKRKFKYSAMYREIFYYSKYEKNKMFLQIKKKDYTNNIFFYAKTRLFENDLFFLNIETKQLYFAGCKGEDVKDNKVSFQTLNKNILRNKPQKFFEALKTMFFFEDLKLSSPFLQFLYMFVDKNFDFSQMEKQTSVFNDLSKEEIDEIKSRIKRIIKV